MAKDGASLLQKSPNLLGDKVNTGVMPEREMLISVSFLGG